MKLLYLLILVGGLFGFLGGIMAALITYHEQRHHYPDSKEPMRIALRTGFYTFSFFVALCLVLAFVFTKLNI